MNSDLEDLKILRMPEVLRLTGLGRTSLYEMMAKGKFPRSVSLGSRSVGWVARDIRAWLQGRNVTSPTLEGFMPMAQKEMSQHPIH